MRYRPEHKVAVHLKIVQDASRRLRTEGLAGAAVAAVMKDTGLTHGGFYKHFRSKNELLMASLGEAFRETADLLAQAAERSQPETAWKAIVKTYLSPEHCDHASQGCPLAALACDLGRGDKAMKARIPREVTRYRNRLLPYMPGRRDAEKERSFLLIFSTMIGAVQIARLLPKPARAKVLATARRFLLRSF